jgi:ATP-binding protein involved in chromosome partitioning
MKLDRKEILKALETITIAGRKEYGGKRSGYKRSHFWRWVVVDLVLHTPAMHIKKRAEMTLKNNPRLSFRSKLK